MTVSEGSVDVVVVLLLLLLLVLVRVENLRERSEYRRSEPRVMRTLTVVDEGCVSFEALKSMAAYLGFLLNVCMSVREQGTQFGRLPFRWEECGWIGWAG